MLAQVHKHPRLSIVTHPTVSGIGHPSSPYDPQASLRAELLGQLVAAQFDIEAVMNEVAGNATALSENKAQLQLLSALQRQIGMASPVALAGLRSEIAATVSAAQAIAQHSRDSVTTNDRMAELRDVTNATRATIAQVADDLFEKKKLDPYLQFASAEDEADYRKREAERKAYIERELAKGTPEGALNAAEAAKTQMDDARNHGADASPDFDSMYGAVTSAVDTQRAAMAQQEKPPNKTPAPPQTETASDLDQIAATLRMAGVAVPDASAKPSNAHGLSEIAGVEPSTSTRML